MSSPTIRDVAQKANVGIGTVSRVLNNSPKVTPETRKRVLEAIAELGFKPNSIARMLPRKTRIHNIGVITQPFVNFRSFGERLRGVQRGLDQHGTSYEIVLYSVNSLAHFDERLVTIVQTGAVDGLIIIDLDLVDSQKQMLENARLPFVGINHFRNRDWPCIATNNYEGAAMAAQHLLSLGHRKIAYIGDDFMDIYGFNTSTERFEGCKRALHTAGLTIPDAYVKLGLHDYETAKQLTFELLELPDPPTAIFTMSDIQALGCIAAARQQGLRVPDDLSVIGYDDLEISMYTGLTTVRQHLEMSGRAAVEALMRLLNGNPALLPSLPPLEVIVRQTTRALS